MTKEEKIEYQKQWRIRNKEKVQGYRDKYKPKIRTYCKKNKDYIVSKVNRWKSENPEKAKTSARRYVLKKMYGISLEQYETMRIEQNYCCAICGKREDNGKRKLHVDHDHKTGKIRSLLCFKCNGGIGAFNEDISLLDKVKCYLIKFNKYGENIQF